MVRGPLQVLVLSLLLTGGQSLPHDPPPPFSVIRKLTSHQCTNTDACCALMNAPWIANQRAPTPPRTTYVDSREAYIRQFYKISFRCEDTRRSRDIPGWEVVHQDSVVLACQKGTEAITGFSLSLVQREENDSFEGDYYAMKGECRPHPAESKTTGPVEVRAGTTACTQIMFVPDSIEAGYSLKLYTARSAKFNSNLLPIKEEMTVSEVGSSKIFLKAFAEELVILDAPKSAPYRVCARAKAGEENFYLYSLVESW